MMTPQEKEVGDARQDGSMPALEILWAHPRSSLYRAIHRSVECDAKSQPIRNRSWRMKISALRVSADTRAAGASA
jgi:hypothetical protein